MNRKEAREFVMQCVFQMEAQQDFEAPDIEKYISRAELGDQKGYVENLLKTAGFKRIITAFTGCMISLHSGRNALGIHVIEK